MKTCRECITEVACEKAGRCFNGSSAGSPPESPAQSARCALATCSAFDRAQWEESPECRRCFVPMSLNAGCEWPDDDRALLCGSCLTRALESTLAQLDEVDEALTELGWHTDRGILQRVKRLTASSPNI